MNNRRAEFLVLLGTDHSGKSSVMRRLRDRAELGLVSCDEDFVAAPYQSLVPLRMTFLNEVLPCARDMHSPDFLLSGLQMAVVYQRDRALAELGRRHVLVDSYYYKILAKSSLLGLDSPEIFSTWRGYARPDRVLFLHVPPEVAFERARNTGRLNRFEMAWSGEPRRAFLDFQSQLIDRMLQEVRGLPLHIIDASQDADRVLREVESLLPKNPS